MKKKCVFRVLSIAGLSFLIMGGTILAVSYNKDVIQTQAYSVSNDSLPSTIDLNDSTDSEIRNYYSSLNGKVLAN